jgi:predicted DNA-binding protein
MKMRLKALKPRPRTKATMRDAIEDHIRENLIMSFRSRCVKCIENKGGLVRF